MHYAVLEEFIKKELILGFKNSSGKLEFVELSWIVLVLSSILFCFLGFILLVSSKKYMSIEDIKYTPIIDRSK